MGKNKKSEPIKFYCMNCGKEEMIEGFECSECREEFNAFCVECGRAYKQESDIILCDKCRHKFDLEELWRLHDANQLDALDFNELRAMRERFRIKKEGE